MAKPFFKRVNDIVNDETIQCEDLQLLPFCHITKGSIFQDIVNSQELRGAKCPVLEKEAIFFFYGKPRYIPTEDAQSIIGGHAPVCILFDYHNLKEKEVTIFPFDSGGFSRYEAPVDWSVREYIMHSGNATSQWDVLLKRYIKKIYGTNQNYLNRRVLDDFKCEGKTFHDTLRFVIELHDSFNTLSARKYGEQATSIEIQIQESCLVLSPIVIFLPLSRFWNDDGPTQIVTDIEKQFSVEACPYEDSQWDISESYFLMRKEVKDYILKNYVKKV